MIKIRQNLIRIAFKGAITWSCLFTEIRTSSSGILSESAVLNGHPTCTIWTSNYRFFQFDSACQIDMEPEPVRGRSCSSSSFFLHCGILTAFRNRDMGRTWRLRPTEAMVGVIAKLVCRTRIHSQQNCPGRRGCPHAWSTYAYILRRSSLSLRLRWWVQDMLANLFSNPTMSRKYLSLVSPFV